MEGSRKRNIVRNPNETKKQASLYEDLDVLTQDILAKTNMLLKNHVVIQSAQMDPAMQNEAIDVAVRAIELYKLERDIADHIKSVFDHNHGANWHCIVGNHFGSAVSHEPNHVIHISLDSLNVYLFKTL